jgi:hypothetical protein
MNTLTKIKVYVVIAAITIIIIVLTYFYANISTGLTKSAVSSIIYNLKPDSIEYYLFYTEDTHNSIIRDTLFLRDTIGIRKITTELTNIEKYSFNHPITEWDVNIKIKFKNRPIQNFYIELAQSDERNGTCLTILKESSWGTFNLGEYRNDHLGKVIKDLVKK